jgi:hypothetical protein
LALLEGRGRGGGHEGSKGDDGELHLDGWVDINYFKSKGWRARMRCIGWFESCLFV